MEYLQAIILGIVQGITEFLPVSSTGHLILLEKLFHLSPDKFGLPFDALLHLGTLMAVVWYFRNNWIEIIKGFFEIIKDRKIETDNQKEVIYLILATIPAVILGALFESKIETVLRSEIIVALALIIFGLIIWWADKVGKKTKDIHDLHWSSGIAIGFAQAIALIPGVSRSGVTMAVGLFSGLKRDESARFTFLLSAPIIFGAGMKKLFDVVKLVLENRLALDNIFIYILGMLFSTIFGYLTIKYFIAHIKSNSLTPYVIYRIILGLIVLALFVF